MRLAGREPAGATAGFRLMCLRTSVAAGAGAAYQPRPKAMLTDLVDVPAHIDCRQRRLDLQGEPWGWIPATSTKFWMGAPAVPF